jgi:hypothetical protein
LLTNPFELPTARDHSKEKASMPTQTFSHAEQHISAPVRPPRTQRQLPGWAVTLDAPFWWVVRLQLHLLTGAVPVLAISAEVFGWVSLKTVAESVMLPLVAVTTIVVLRRPDRSDRVILSGFLWGLIACAAYDAFRLPTIYGTHWWSDFFGRVGGSATGGGTNFLVGYLWRYVGDGGGIAVAFFAVAATLGAATWPTKQLFMVAISFAVCPVWSGLVLTDLLAPADRKLFPVTASTLVLSLVGHIIYGSVLALGYLASRSQEAAWPLTITRGVAAPR